MFSLIYAAIVVILVYYFLSLPFRYWERMGLPSPQVSKIFGNITEAVFMQKNLGQVYDDIYNKFPQLKYVGIYKGRNPCILLRDPELVREVLVKSFNNFHDNEISIDETVEPLFAKNAFPAKGEQWKEARNQVSPSFTLKRVKALYPVMDSVCKNLVEYINSKIDKNDRCLEAKHLSCLFTTDNVTLCALGLDSNCFKNPNSEYFTMCKKIQSPSFWGNVRMMMLYAFPPLAALLNTRFVPEDVSDYFKNVVISTLKYRNENSVQRDDFLGTMLELENKLGKEVFTVDHIIAHVLGFYIDGFETSAVVLCFALYELCLNPDIKKHLEKEIEEICHKHNGTLSYEALQEMLYLEKIINETMRKHTVVPELTRECTEQFTFPPASGKGSGISVKPNTPIVIPIYSFHHDPKYYPEPFCFDPERFSPENIDKINKFTYLPFGEGPRMCPGIRFGMLQTKLALISIIQNFEIELSPKTKTPYEIDPYYMLLAAKDGIWLNFYKKKHVMN